MRTRLLVSIALPLAIATAESSARADDKEQCVASFDQAQTLRDEGKLRAARTQLLACARESCPSMLRRDCEKTLAELDQTMPTVVFGARDPKGNDVVGTRVSLDGVPLVDRLDGRPVPIDPGEHTFRYEAPNAAPVEQHAIIRVGEKNRMLTAVLAPAAKPAAPAVVPAPVPASMPAPEAKPEPAAPAHDEEPAAPSSGGVPAGTWILGGIGLAAIGSFAYFGLSGRSDVDDLRSTCGQTSSCAQSDVDAAHMKLVIADVSLGVGVVALAAATWIFLARDTAPTGVIQADVQARPGGAVATFGARF